MLEKLGKGRETNWVSHWHWSCFDYGLGKLYVNSWLEIQLTLLANKSESNWQCHSLMSPSHQHITSLVKFHLSPHAITLRWHIFKYDKMYLVDINSLLFIPPRALRHCLSAWLALMKWSQMLLGRSLVIGWRKKSLNPETLSGPKMDFHYSHRFSWEKHIQLIYHMPWLYQYPPLPFHRSYEN